MVNLLEQDIYKKKFLDLLKVKNYDDFKNKDYKIIIEEKHKTKKVKINCDKIINLKEKNLEIEITNNCEILINFIKPKSYCFLKIKVLKNVKANIYLFLDNTSFLITQIDCLKNSNVKVCEFVKKSELFFFEAKLFEKSKIDILSGCYFRQNSYLFNSVKHIEKSSTSNVLSRVLSLADKIINDGLIKIEKNSKLSKGFLELENIIISKESKILTEPVLEIENNNVVCSHKASVSNVKEDTKFFLQTKGYTDNEIIKIIVKDIMLNPIKFISSKKILQNLEKNILSGL